jgi:hypothetical protein
MKNKRKMGNWNRHLKFDLLLRIMREPDTQWLPFE